MSLLIHFSKELEKSPHFCGHSMRELFVSKVRKKHLRAIVRYSCLCQRDEAVDEVIRCLQLPNFDFYPDSDLGTEYILETEAKISGLIDEVYVSISITVADYRLAVTC